MPENRKKQIYYYEDKSIASVFYINDDGEIDNGNEPAVIYYNKEGAITSKEYYWYGDLHRDGDLPAIVQYTEDGETTIEKQYYECGILDRENDKPSYIKYDKKTGNIRTKLYSIDGTWDREDDKPIIEEYYNNGGIAREIYKESDTSETPYIKEYYKDGYLKYEGYFIGRKKGRYDSKPSDIFYRNDKDQTISDLRCYHPEYGLHNLEDYAVVSYDKNGKPTKQTFYEFGKKLKNEQFKVRNRKEILKNIKKNE